MESLLGLLHEAPPLNFELQEERRIALKKHIDSRMRLAVYILLAAILFVGGVWAQRSDQLDALSSSQSSWNGRISRETTLQKAALGRLETIVPVSSTLTRAFEPGQKLSDIVAVVSDSLPKDAWLTGITLQRGTPMEIRGTAETPGDVGSLVSSLGSNPRFRDVTLVFANSGLIDKTPVEQFDISVICVGNLPMPEPIKVMPRRAQIAPADSSDSSSDSSSTADSGSNGAGQ
jgi:hypothetical protein